MWPWRVLSQDVCINLHLRLEPGWLQHITPELECIITSVRDIGTEGWRNPRSRCRCCQPPTRDHIQFKVSLHVFGTSTRRAGEIHDPDVVVANRPRVIRYNSKSYTLTYTNIFGKLPKFSVCTENAIHRTKKLPFPHVTVEGMFGALCFPYLFY